MSETTLPELPQQFKDVIESIAKEHFPSVDSLEITGISDSDFHDIAVWQIKSALEGAFFAGFYAGQYFFGENNNGQ